jgi:heat shock protein HslJ
MMKNIKFCVLAMLALPLTGCFSNQQLLSESDQYVGEWILEGGISIPGITKRQPSMIIEEDLGVAGFTGCNLFKGKLNIDDSAVNFTLSIMTHKMCLPEIVEQEQNIMNVLRHATNIEVVNETLVVDSGDRFLVFEKANQHI